MRGKTPRSFGFVFLGVSTLRLAKCPEGYGAAAHIETPKNRSNFLSLSPFRLVPSIRSSLLDTNAPLVVSLYANSTDILNSTKLSTTQSIVRNHTKTFFYKKNLHVPLQPLQLAPHIAKKKRVSTGQRLPDNYNLPSLVRTS